MHIFSDNILACIPHERPFRFVDGITNVSESAVTGFYTYREDEFFYKGHFPGNPVTPGVILIETLAQAGLLPLGIYLLGKDKGWDTSDPANIPAFVLTGSEVDFLHVVLPGEQVVVSAEKIYFRLGKLKVKAQMFNAEGKTVCRGILSGMLLKR
ncbi:MAG: hydroxymyristoyl-ACP dehydratase [Bacteroidia bacterium]